MFLNPTPARAGARASSHSSSATTSGRAASPDRGQLQNLCSSHGLDHADELEQWPFEEVVTNSILCFPKRPRPRSLRRQGSPRAAAPRPCSSANTRARRCEKISDCHGRRTRSSARRKIDPTGLSTPRPHVGHSTTAEVARSHGEGGSNTARFLHPAPRSHDSGRAVSAGERADPTRGASRLRFGLGRSTSF
jgi:hypothetical protein